jgi:predicted regulator of Ras-like GTPase activity (Roadblock/LC7/MglB family)
MSFSSVLRKIVDGSGGGLAAALMGPDGIPIEEVSAAGADPDAAEEASVLGIEFGRILQEMRKASDSVEGGAVQEVSVRLVRRWVLLREVDPETTLVVTLGPDGNAGKARYLMRRHLIELRDQL